ncbi:MAG: hypothetical protein WBF39_12970, partial [Planococcus donghaensis]
MAAAIKDKKVFIFIPPYLISFYHNKRDIVTNYCYKNNKLLFLDADMQVMQKLLSCMFYSTKHKFSWVSLKSEKGVYKEEVSIYFGGIRLYEKINNEHIDRECIC